MRLERSILLAVLIGVSIAAVSPAYGEDKNWELRTLQTVRIDNQHDEDHTYLARLEIPFHYRLSDDWDVTLSIEPFAETRYKWEPEETSRSEVGGEAGFQLTEFAYVGEGFHYAWLDEQEDTFELESKLEIFIPFVLNSSGYRITTWLLEEYTFSVEEGKATRNEIAAYFIFPVIEHCELMSGWRHIDRIHDYDSDQFEITAIITF